MRHVLQLAAILTLPFTALHLGFNVTLGDLFFFTVLALSLQRVSIDHPAVALLSVGIATGVAISTIIDLGSSRPFDIPESMQAIVLFLFVIPVGSALLRDLDDRLWMRYLVVGGVLHAIMAIVQVMRPDLRLPTQPASGLGAFGQRPAGFAGNPNGLGLIETWIVPIAVHLAATSQTRSGQWWWGIAAFTCAIGGILSFSKMAWLLIPAVLLISIALAGRRRTALIVILMIASVLLLTVFRDVLGWMRSIVSYRFAYSESLGGRLEGIESAWATFDKWWLFGLGAGNDSLVSMHGTRIHNQLIGLAVQFGIPAALAFLALKAILLVEGWRRSRSSFGRTILLVFVVSEMSMIVHPVYWVRAHYLPILIMLHHVRSDRGEECV